MKPLELAFKKDVRFIMIFVACGLMGWWISGWIMHWSRTTTVERSAQVLLGQLMTESQQRGYSETYEENGNMKWRWKKYPELDHDTLMERLNSLEKGQEEIKKLLMMKTP